MVFVITFDDDLVFPAALNPRVQVQTFGLEGFDLEGPFHLHVNRSIWGVITETEEMWANFAVGLKHMFRLACVALDQGVDTDRIPHDVYESIAKWWTGAFTRLLPKDISTLLTVYSSARRYTLRRGDLIMRLRRCKMDRFSLQETVEYFLLRWDDQGRGGTRPSFPGDAPGAPPTLSGPGIGGSLTGPSVDEILSLNQRFETSMDLDAPATMSRPIPKVNGTLLLDIEWNPHESDMSPSAARGLRRMLLPDEEHRRHWEEVEERLLEILRAWPTDYPAVEYDDLLGLETPWVRQWELQRRRALVGFILRLDAIVRLDSLMYNDDYDQDNEGDDEMGDEEHMDEDDGDTSVMPLLQCLEHLRIEEQTQPAHQG